MRVALIHANESLGVITLSRYLMFRSQGRREWQVGAAKKKAPATEASAFTLYRFPVYALLSSKTVISGRKPTRPG